MISEHFDQTGIYVTTLSPASGHARTNAPPHLGRVARKRLLLQLLLQLPRLHLPPPPVFSTAAMRRREWPSSGQPRNPVASSAPRRTDRLADWRTGWRAGWLTCSTASCALVRPSSACVSSARRCVSVSSSTLRAAIAACARVGWGGTTVSQHAPHSACEKARVHAPSSPRDVICRDGVGRYAPALAAPCAEPRPPSRLHPRACGALRSQPPWHIPPHQHQHHQAQRAHAAAGHRHLTRRARATWI